MIDLIIDTDTGSDDAVALMLALGNPEVNVKAITTVAGNVPVDFGSKNALATVALMGKNTPVYQGFDRPLMRDLHTAQNVHGADGMSGAPIPTNIPKLSGFDAVNKLIELPKAEPGKYTLVTLGPLTNIAAALFQDPNVLSYYKEIYCMAGSPEGWGNVTPSAEFNIWCDPESFKVVLRSGTPIVMVGWNISREYAVIAKPETDNFKKIGTARSNYLLDINIQVAKFCKEVTGIDGFDLPDPITMAIAINPNLITKSELVRMDVACDEFMRGTLIIDRSVAAQKLGPNVKVIWEADREGFLNSLYEMCQDGSNPTGFTPRPLDFYL